MNVFKFFPILLMVGTIAIYCTGNYASEVTTFNSTNVSSIVVKAPAKSKNKAALERAEQIAFEALLFEGVPGTAQPLPLVNDVQKFKMEHNSYYLELLKNKKYKNFIQSMEVVYDNGIAGNKKINLAVKVNLKALKKDLVLNNISSI